MQAVGLLTFPYFRRPKLNSSVYLYLPRSKFTGMKKITITAIALSSGLLFSCDQKPKVPAEVQAGFNRRYAEVQEMEWELDSEDNVWEAEFEGAGKERNAVFTPAGEWVETEQEVSVQDLPEAVKNLLTFDYKGYEIYELEFVETPNGNFYEAELEKDGQDKELELRIAPNGKLSKRENEVEKEDEKEGN